MSLNFEEMLSKVTDFLRSEAKTETVIGEQFQLGEFSCVPVIRVGIGFGSGGGEGEAGKKGQSGTGSGGGAGGGLGVEPIGFLVSKADQIEFVSTRKNRGLGVAFEKAPELIEKFLNRNKEESQATEKAGG